jgi:hypothetical protein
MSSVRSATQYRQFRSLIQTEAQTYKTLRLIPNPTSTNFAQNANWDVQNVMARGLVIKAVKQCL